MTPCLPRLNTPDYSDKIRIRYDADKTDIWDAVRNKWVRLTPEEWIRQNMILYIIDTINVSINHIANETEIIYNNLKRRCDTVIFTPNGSPLIVVEYKRHNIKITQKTFDQAALYCMHLNVPYLIISNGIQHLMCKIDPINKRYVFAQKWPLYQSLITPEQK